MDAQPEKRILAVGMLPPPHGGQAIMFDWAVRRLSEIYSVDVVDIQAQKNIGAVGRLSFNKLLVLASIIRRCLAILLSFRDYDVLYYCPSGPSGIGLLKDLAILTLLRSRAHRIVYHFHGTGGIAHLLNMHPLIVNWARKVMFAPDLTIRCAAVEPNDALLCGSQRDVILANGIPDPGAPGEVGERRELRFCFIGAVTEEKGVLDLVEIARRLREYRSDFVIDLIGEGLDDEIERLDALIAAHGLQRHLVRRGVLLGEQKFAVLRKATLFLFPTYFRAETQPLVVIEAAAVGVPSVASDWRGLRSIVVDGVTGALIPPRSPAAFADKVIELLESGKLPAMKRAARQHFLENFTQELFLRRLEEIFASLLNENQNGIANEKSHA